jgi:hypothetical protein
MERKNRERDFYPVGVIETQPAGRNDAMDMRVQTEFLVPSVQHVEETNFRAKVSGITSDLKKCFGAGPKQQAIDELLVL